MATADETALYHFLRTRNDSVAHKLAERLENTSEHELVLIYQEAIPRLEKALWAEEPDQTSLNNYQQIFRELEALIANQKQDNRHHFILFIPVADRPRQLDDCLSSILQLCKLFNYGGKQGQCFKKVSVMVADDSKNVNNITQHKKLVKKFNLQGLSCLYFGQEQQRQQLRNLSDEQKEKLAGVVGHSDVLNFYHKGSPKMRNIISLKLNELQRQYKKVLFYSLDSDQEFQVKLNTRNGDRDLYTINYFYYLDQIFSQTDATIVTGKVVGDPPVSPAVMVVNFLQDIINFLRKMVELDNNRACDFHSAEVQLADDAAYHDMPELFGFKHKQHSCDYRCSLPEPHNNGESFNDFAKKLNSFFYGEHPTRKTYYQYQPALESLSPARTVYPGNYIFNIEGLKHFIPFAPLKLRMNGPVMGRLVKSELKQKFLSANLPMLHKRTVADTGQSEYRPDILQGSEKIDLSGEFERQYFGDVMLFSMEVFTEQGYPETQLEHETVSSIVTQTEKKMQQQYIDKHRLLLQKRDQLSALLQDSEAWWNQHPEYKSARNQFDAFIKNVNTNFDDDSYSYRLIITAAEKKARLKQVVEAILNYPTEKILWEQTLASQTAGAH
ncbi:hypothetical protein MNBD_GAMMA25-524 [hydrothermal vent metagenome]|uniref:Uncharacterized protein n=1 Tax=hydrothermal vent metagenome TaxID=652676 RepID=A0A3B1B2H1_9ZZZZ